MTDQEMINYINENKMILIHFSVPFEDKKEAQEVEMVISNLIKLEKNGYDVWGHFTVNIDFNQTSEFDCQQISSFFEKYKDCHFITVQKRVLRDILNSNFKSEMVGILKKSNIIYNAELEDIDQELLKKFQIQSVLIGTDRKGKDKFSFPISIEKSEEIIKIARRITRDLPKDNEKLKFLEIEQRLASILTLDTNDKLDSSLESKRNRNLECLLQGKAVCVGCAIALAQICSLVGIECRVVTSLKGSELEHVYNQVKIDGTWYNTDLTWDILNHLKCGVMPQFFLLSDKTFQSRCHVDERVYHCPKDDNVIKCDTDMPLSMEEVEICMKNLINWKKLSTPLKIRENEISI